MGCSTTRVVPRQRKLVIKRTMMITFTLYLCTFIAVHSIPKSLAHGISRSENLTRRRCTRSTVSSSSAFLFSNRHRRLGLQQLTISRGGDGFNENSTNLNPRSSHSNDSPVTRHMVLESASGGLSMFAGIFASSKIAPMSSMVFGSISDFYRNYPFLSGFLTCAIKASVADIVAQKQFGQQDLAVSTSSNDDKATLVLNKQRTLAFFLYGGLFQGCVLEIMFNHVLPYWFGNGTDAVTVACKALFDIMLFGPLVTLPVAYLAKACIFRYGVGEAMGRYWHDVTIHKLVLKFGLFWGPVNCLVFSVIPPHFRIAFIALMSFFWMIVLSYTSNKSDMAAAVKAAAVKESM